MILDIIFILMFFLAILVGYKVGFLRYILKIASILAGFISSLLLVGPISKFVIDTSMGQYVKNIVRLNVENTEAFTTFGDDATISEIFTELGFSDVLATIIESIIKSMNTVETTLLEAITYSITLLLITIVTFFALWLGSAILFKVLKLVTEIIRNAKSVRVIDGIIGIFLSVAIYFFTSFVIVAVVYYLQNIDAVSNTIEPFMTEQIDTSFGVYSYYFNENVFIKFISLFIFS